MKQFTVRRGNHVVKRKWEYVDVQVITSPGWRMSYKWKGKDKNGKRIPGTPNIFVNPRDGCVSIKLRKLKEMVTL